MINILFTCAGRRVELVQQFQKTKSENNISGNIICTDMSETAPALYFADKFYSVPSLTSFDYIPKLIDICKNENISLVIPTIDTEITLLSENINHFENIGTKVLLPNKKTIEIAQDKYKTYLFFKSIGLDTPITYLPEDTYDNEFPCFIKPYNGSSSINAFKVNNECELNFFRSYINGSIVQNFIEGVEYTIDAFSDFDSIPIFITPRIRLATRSGEVLKTKIVDEPELISLVRKLMLELNSIGPITVQAIKSNIDNKFYFIEINARFGGGSPLSMMAGANSSLVLYNLLSDKAAQSMSATKINYGAVFVRFDQSIALYQRESGDYVKL